MPPRYAKETSVDSQVSIAEIERTVRRYGADEFSYGWRQDEAAVGFTFKGRSIRLVIPMPDPKGPAFTRTAAKGQPRSAEAARKEHEQAVRQRWRVLLLAIKAKLEVVESGIRTFEQEFGLDIVMANGQTVGEQIIPQLIKATGGPLQLTAGEGPGK